VTVPTTPDGIARGLPCLATQPRGGDRTAQCLACCPWCCFGAGSELYRGLGSVVVVGLALAAAVTLCLVPVMFSLAIDVRHALTGRAAKGAATE